MEVVKLPMKEGTLYRSQAETSYKQKGLCTISSMYVNFERPFQGEDFFFINYFLLSRYNNKEKI
jgi:hypothetical protein